MIAKYLEQEGGWVGVKNRDRNYKPTISIKQSFKEGVESIFIFDYITKYSEGMNEHGLSILNTATTVKNDESEAADARRKMKKVKKSEGTYYSPDGITIRQALKLKTPEQALKFLKEKELKGNFLVFNKDECYILEGGSEEKAYRQQVELSKNDSTHEWEELPYISKETKLKKEDICIRTNHGLLLPWMGYDPDSEDIHITDARKSSDERLKVAAANVKEETTPEGLLRSISDISHKNPQMNPLRLDNPSSSKTLKTTAQIMLNPADNRLTFRPIWGNTLAKNFDQINRHASKLYVNFLSYKLESKTYGFKEYYFE